MATSRNTLQLVINGVNRAGPALQQVAQDVAAMSAAVTASIGVAVNEARKLELGMAEIGTLMDGDVTPALGRMKQQLLDISALSGQSLDKLTKANYDIISAGFSDAAEATNVLIQSVKLAEASVVDVSVAADVLTTTLNAFGYQAADVAEVSDVLFQIVRKGKTTMDELGPAVAGVAKTASVAKIPLEEVGAAFAVLTANGIPVREAGTAIRGMLLALGAPTDQAAAALKEVGVTLDDGLLPAMESLRDVVPQGLDAIRELVPEVEAMKAIATAAEDVEGFTDAIGQMEDSTGVVQSGFEDMQETTDRALKRMQGAFRALLVVIGDAFLPVVQDAAERIFNLMTYIRESPQAFIAALNSVAKFAAKIVSAGIAIFAFIKVVQAANATMTLLQSKFILSLGVIVAFIEAVKWLERANAAWAGDGLTPINDALDNMTEKIRDAVLDLPVLGDLMKAMGQDTGDAAAKLDELLARLERLSESDLGEPGTVDLAPPIDETMEDSLRRTASFMREDWVPLVISTGEATAAAFSDATLALVGLSDSARTFGQVFKGMIAGVISDVVRLITRILVAKALMSALGINAEASTSGAGGLGPTASTIGGAVGMAVGGPIGAGIGSLAGGLFASSGFYSVPGTPGVDSTMLFAGGGEMVLSRPRADMLRQALMLPQEGPGFEAFQQPSGRKRRAVQFIVQRPFRRSEQIDLVNSVQTSEDEAGRYRT